MIKVNKPFLKAEQVYNRSKCNGIFTSKALADILSSPNFSELLEATKRSVDTIGTPDPVLTKVLEEMGFTALPIMVDSSHYELLIKSGLTPVYRGVRKDDAIVDFATNLNMFVGRGIYCNGVHFVYEDKDDTTTLGKDARAMAERYASRQPQGFNKKIDEELQTYSKGQVIQALISENAKIIELRELLKLRNMFLDGLRNNSTISDDTKQKMIKLFSKETSIIAALEGFDMIVAKGAKFVIVLNRGALIMNKEDVGKNM